MIEEKTEKNKKREIKYVKGTLAEDFSLLEEEYNSGKFYCFRPTIKQDSNSIKFVVPRDKFYLKGFYKYFDSNETTSKGPIYKAFDIPSTKDEAHPIYEIHYFINDYTQNEIDDIKLYDSRYSKPFIPYHDQLQIHPISHLVSDKKGYVHNRICLQGYVDEFFPYDNVFYQLFSEGLSKGKDKLPIYLRYREDKVIHTVESTRDNCISSKGFSLFGKKPLEINGNLEYREDFNAYCLYINNPDKIKFWFPGYYSLFINWLEDNAGSYMIILLFAILANFIYDCLKWLAGLLF